MSWNRLLWGVELSSPLSKPKLIGSLWHGQTPYPYPDEPTRALLFCTRKAAREWCRAEMAKCAWRCDYCSDWRFRPVRVRETVKVVK